MTRAIVALGIGLLAVAGPRAGRADVRGPLLVIDGSAPTALRSFDDGAARAPGTMAVDVEGLTAPMASAIDRLLEGHTASRPFVVTGPSGRKKGKARLVSAKLPAVGVGGNGIVQLVFATEDVVKSPFVLAAAGETRGLEGRKLAGVRAELDGAPLAIAGVEGISLRAGDKGARVEGEVALTVATSSLAPLAKAAQSGAPRGLTVEYVDVDQRRVLAFELTGCRVKGAKPSGSPTTRVSVDCTSARRAGPSR